MSAAGERFWTRETKALVALVGVVALLAVFAGGGPESARSGLEKASTFLTHDGGAAALYLAAQELRLSTNRWMLPFPDDATPESSSIRALAILAPSEPLLASEAGWLRSWIERGGHLVYVGSGDRTDELVKALGLEYPLRFGMPRGVRAQRPEHPSPLAERLLDGTPRELKGSWTSFTRTPDADFVEPLLSVDDSHMTAALVTIGRGQAVVLSDADGISNARLKEGELAPLILRSLADAAGDGSQTVWFDEFHHGYDERASPTRAAWRFLSGTHAGWALVEIAILSLLALVFAGIRVGRALAVPPPLHRSSLEHVNALAAAYRESTATRRPAALLVDGLRVRVGARSREELMQWLDAVAVSHPALHKEAEHLANQARRTTADADLVALTKSIDRVLEEESRVGTD